MRRIRPIGWIFIILGVLLFGVVVVRPVVSSMVSRLTPSSLGLSTGSDNGSSSQGKNNSPGSGSSPSQGSAPSKPVNGPTIQVGTVQFGTYLSAVGATKYASDRGVNIQLVDLSGQEGIQCDWVAGRPTKDFPAAPSGVTRILFTTHNAARVCEGVKIAMVIDQSSGADMLITRPDITDYSQIFRQPVSMAGDCSVSEYFYRTLAWTFGVSDGSNLRLSPGPDPAVAAFVKDPSIKTLVSYVPNADDALKGAAGSKKFLTTENWAGIVDVAVIKAEPSVNDTTKRFLGAWFDFVKLESENFDQAFQVLVQYHQAHPEETIIRDYVTEKGLLKDELTNLVAQASFVDNTRMMVQDTTVLQARLNEVDAVQREFPCKRQGQVPQPSSFSTKDMIDGRYIQALAQDSKLSTSSRTVSKRRITLSTTVPLETAVGVAASEKLAGQLASVYVEFQSDSDQFADDNAARDVLERNFAAVLRLTNNTVLEVVGGYASPRGCINCDDKSGSDLALKRAARVRQLLINDLRIDQGRIRVSQTVRKPANPGSADPTLVRQDRRVEGKLLIVGGQ